MQIFRILNCNIDIIIKVYLDFKDLEFALYRSHVSDSAITEIEIYGRI